MFFSLKNRIMLTFTLLFMVPFLILSFVVPHHFAAILENKIEAATLQTMDQNSLFINSITLQAEEISKQVLGNQLSQQWISSRKNAPEHLEHHLIIKNQLKEVLSTIMMNNSNEISISVFLNDGAGSWVNDSSFLQNEWYQTFMDTDRRWVAAHLDPYQSAVEDHSIPVNSYLLPLIDMFTFEVKGVIKVNFKTSLLKDALNKIQLGKGSQVYLVDWQGAKHIGVVQRKELRNSSGDRSWNDPKSAGRQRDAGVQFGRKGSLCILPKIACE